MCAVVAASVGSFIHGILIRFLLRYQNFVMVVCISGLVLYEIKELWRVALLISTLSYPQLGSFSQAELHRRKEKYVRVERLITDLGKELN
jgi:hypothetical protein